MENRQEQEYYRGRELVSISIRLRDGTVLKICRTGSEAVGRHYQARVLGPGHQNLAKVVDHGALLLEANQGFSLRVGLRDLAECF